MITQEDIEAMEDGMEDELLNKLCDERKENTSLMNRIEQLERELARARVSREDDGMHIIGLQSQLTAEKALADRLAVQLKIAEAALSDIGDAEREDGDDLQWCEKRAAKAIPGTRAELAAYRKARGL